MDEWHTLNTNEYQLPKQTFGGTQKAVEQQPRRIKALVWATSCQTEVTLLLPLPLHLSSSIPHPCRAATPLGDATLPPVQLHSVSCVGQTNATSPLPAYADASRNIYTHIPWLRFD
ncbi:uncharacterized protein Dere_GG26544 [Drosophila erecta]|uniref:Uncharacterized protein n=1 Tax=Drosophila erecta TaxID=7220 RepID=A0A0Q5WC50_DROER|nr:uncharacterized protein Dere_GG26544 [Drosophila erecta]